MTKELFTHSLIVPWDCSSREIENAPCSLLPLTGVINHTWEVCAYLIAASPQSHETESTRKQVISCNFKEIQFFKLKWDLLKHFLFYCEKKFRGVDWGKWDQGLLLIPPWIEFQGLCNEWKSSKLILQKHFLYNSVKSEMVVEKLIVQIHPNVCRYICVIMRCVLNSFPIQTSVGIFLI